MKTNERTNLRVGINAKTAPLTLRSNMTNLPEDLQGPILTRSPTPSEKSNERVTKEDLQATLMAILKSLERCSLNMERNFRGAKEEMDKGCSMNPQKRSDLEHSTPENDNVGRAANQTSLMKEPVVSLFPLLKKEWDKEKNKEDTRASQLALNEIKKPKLSDPLSFSLNNRGQYRLEIVQTLGESQTNAVTGADPFLQALVNMINLTWAEKRKEKATKEVRAER
ncbi:hypothetical protein ACFX2B_014600 [Malus domestica]